MLSPMVGDCRRFTPNRRHLPAARQKKRYRERGKSWIFSRLESATKMLCTGEV
jgi:hypothetical protein